MDQLGVAAIQRARSALDMAFNQDSQDIRRKAFFNIAFCMAKAKHRETALALMQANDNALVNHFAKSAQVGFDPAWGAEGQSLFAAAIPTLRPMSLYDNITLFAPQLPTKATRTLIASDAVADTVSEGLPKPVIKPGLSIENAQTYKPAAIVVMGEEFLHGTDGAGQQLLETELTTSIAKASNQAVIDRFDTTSATSVATTGDALNDLRAGLRASAASFGYAIAAGTAITADLATRVENKGMGSLGGEFCPFVTIVGIEGYSGMLIIPSSRVAVRDYGFRMDGSWEASLDMRDSPSAPSAQVSLFQVNARALRAERMFSLGGDATAVKVG